MRMLSLFLLFPITPPGGVRDFFTHPARRRLHFSGERTETGMPHVVALADFALIRHYRATFPTQGKASSGGAKR